MCCLLLGAVDVEQVNESQHGAVQYLKLGLEGSLLSLALAETPRSGPLSIATYEDHHRHKLGG